MKNYIKFSKFVLPFIIFILVFLGLFLFLNNNTAISAGECKPIGAISPSGEQSDDWYRGDADLNVIIEVSFQNNSDCWGKQLQVSLVEQDPGLNTDHDKESAMNNRQVDILSGTKKIFFDLKAGEDKCEIKVGSSDCNYYIEITGDNTIQEFSGDSDESKILKYECDWGCFDDWEFLRVRHESGGAPGGGSSSGGGTGGGSGGGGGGVNIDDKLDIADRLREKVPGIPRTIEGLVDRITKLIFQLSIPIAVILIIYSGIRMLISGGNPTQTAAARKILLYTVGGLAIISIGRGFVKLVLTLLGGDLN